MISTTIRALLLSAMLVSPAFAGYQTGTVSKLFIRSSDGLIYFFINGPMVQGAACGGGGYWIIKDENSATGKRQLAALMAARASGQVITVHGDGGCTRWPDGSDVALVEM